MKSAKITKNLKYLSGKLENHDDDNMVDKTLIQHCVCHTAYAVYFIKSISVSYFNYKFIKKKPPQISKMSIFAPFGER